MFLFFVGFLFGLFAFGALFFKFFLTYGIQFYLHPARTPFKDHPQNHGFPFEDVLFRSEDGIPLKGWLIPLSRGVTEKGTVILCHGYSGNKDWDLDRVPFLREDGYNVLLFDFRGHGESGENYTSIGYFETLDLMGAVNYLKNREDVDPSRIFVMGVSMGAAVCILTAAKSPDIKAVVADSGFASLRNAFLLGLGTMGFPKFLRPFFASAGWRAMGQHLRFPVEEAEPVRFIDKISPRPVFIIHGEKDSLVGVENARQLYSSAGDPRLLWIAEGIEHAQIFAYRKEEYKKRVLEFLESATG